MESTRKALLLSENDEEQQEYYESSSLISPATNNNTCNVHVGGDDDDDVDSFVAVEDDIPPINSSGVFFKHFPGEFWKLWSIAGPVTFTLICQYSLGAVTQVFAGHVSTITLAAVSVENSVIAGFSLGVMLGMGSALETLCGQAYGAGQLEALGIYMQRSWVILGTTALLLSLLYIFATQWLMLIGQTETVSKAAGMLALWMIPQLFMYAMNFPMTKFLQSQSKVLVVAIIAFVALVLHTIFSWLLMLKLGLGLVGAAIVLNASWVFIVVCRFLYIVSGTFARSWTGFSFKAFQNLWGFVKLSVASAVMLCLETWYFMALILFAGYLKNAEIAINALSICMNIFGWILMVSLAMNAAVSVRVSNELGAGHPRKAKFALVVASISSTTISLIFSLALLLARNAYPGLFSTDSTVRENIKELTPLLAISIILNNIQPVFSGVAIGAGWQHIVAYINIGCYYIFGIPLGLILGFKLNFGVQGIMIGMMAGTAMQTCILFGIICRTNWDKEASISRERIRKWGGTADDSEEEKPMRVEQERGSRATVQVNH